MSVWLRGERQHTHATHPRVRSTLTLLEAGSVHSISFEFQLNAWPEPLQVGYTSVWIGCGDVMRWCALACGRPCRVARLHAGAHVIVRDFVELLQECTVRDSKLLQVRVAWPRFQIPVWVADAGVACRRRVGV